MIDRSTIRDGLAAACFLFFAAGAAWSASGRAGDVRARQHRASLFVASVLVVSLAVGIFEKDLYPFTSWPLMSWLYPRSYPLKRFVAVDARGTEHDVDYRAWEPLSGDELASWMAMRFQMLGPSQKDSIARDLLRRATDGALRATAGERIGRFDRVLGPLTAPLFHLHPTPWDRQASIPALPLEAFRLYLEQWDPDAGTREARDVPRTLLYELRVNR